MKKRLASAAIMIAIVIPLFIIGGTAFAVGVGIISLLAYKEIIDILEKEKLLPYYIKLIGSITLLLLIFMSFDAHSIELGASYKAISIMLLGLLIPTIFSNNKKNSYTTKDAFFLSGAILLLGIIFNGFILVMNLNKWVFLYLIIITVITDTFAFVFGKLLGKNKLIPSVSPNKTWEGTIFGTILGTIVPTIYYLNMVNGNIQITRLIIITLMLSILGQIGDLLFSKIKRENNIKDFSNMIPGHGGILDRLDSLSIVVLAFLLLMSFV